MTIETIEEGLALYGLGLLPSDDIPELALLFLAQGCEVLEMAALAGSLAIDHPADRRRDLERAVQLAGRAVPTRIQAAQTLKQICAQRGSSGTPTPRDTARRIIDLFERVESELPETKKYWGDSFDISRLIGLYYSYDDIRYDDEESAREIDRDLLEEIRRLTNERVP